MGIDLFSWNEVAGSTPLFLCTTQPPPPEVPLDVKPTSCPNPFNVDKHGVLPVAVLGTATFDVTQIDVSTIRLEGVAPLRTALEDVATPFTPFTGKTECFEDCNTLGPDGFVDLTMKFKAADIAAALGAVSAGDCVVVTLTATLTDGVTQVSGEDVILILTSGKP